MGIINDSKGEVCHINVLSGEGMAYTLKFTFHRGCFFELNHSLSRFFDRFCHIGMLDKHKDSEVHVKRLSADARIKARQWPSSPT